MLSLYFLKTKTKSSFYFYFPQFIDKGWSHMINEYGKGKLYKEEPINNVVLKNYTVFNLVTLI